MRTVTEEVGCEEVKQHFSLKLLEVLSYPAYFEQVIKERRPEDIDKQQYYAGPKHLRKPHA